MLFSYNVIYGNNLADGIDGTFGSDMILAAGGDDTMTGNASIDTFVFFAGNDNGVDAIEDFEVGIDVLTLADLLDADDAGVSVGSSSDGDILLGFDGGGSVELNGVANPRINNLADLADFITVDFG